MKKKLTALIILMAMLFSPAAASADSTGQSRAVIGADLSEQQIEAVYAMFGVKRGDITELTMTNSEEREYLKGYVDEAQLGTRSISCVYVELLPAGSGLEVTTHNITWYTEQMYIGAFATAGISDARVIVAAPFEVSGTSALSGVYKAYEDMTGEKLDATAKQVGTQEITVTGDLANDIGSTSSTSIVNDLKLMLKDTKDMSDDEIIKQIELISKRHNVKLTNTQKEQLLSLCRALELLDGESLRARVEDVQDTLRKMSEAKTKVVSFMDKARIFFDSAGELFAMLKDLFSVFG